MEKEIAPLDVAAGVLKDLKRLVRIYERVVSEFEDAQITRKREHGFELIKLKDRLIELTTKEAAQ